MTGFLNKNGKLRSKLRLKMDFLARFEQKDKNLVALRAIVVSFFDKTQWKRRMKREDKW